MPRPAGPRSSYRSGRRCIFPSRRRSPRRRYSPQGTPACACVRGWCRSAPSHSTPRCGDGAPARKRPRCCCRPPQTWRCWYLPAPQCRHRLPPYHPRALGPLRSRRPAFPRSPSQWCSSRPCGCAPQSRRGSHLYRDRPGRFHRGYVLLGRRSVPRAQQARSRSSPPCGGAPPVRSPPVPALPARLPVLPWSAPSPRKRRSPGLPARLPHNRRPAPRYNSRRYGRALPCRSYIRCRWSAPCPPDAAAS